MSEPTAAGAANIEKLQAMDAAFHQIGVETVRRALTARDQESAIEQLGPFATLVSDLLDPELEIDLTRWESRWPGGGRYHGFAGWLEFWREWLDPWEEFVYTRPRTEAIGDWVASEVLLDARGAGSGVPAHWHFFQLWNFRDGRIAYLATFETWSNAVAAITD